MSKTISSVNQTGYTTIDEIFSSTNIDREIYIEPPKINTDQIQQALKRRDFHKTDMVNLPDTMLNSDSDDNKVSVPSKMRVLVSRRLFTKGDDKGEIKD